MCIRDRDYGGLNYGRFLQASIAGTPVPVDRRYRPFGENPPPPPPAMDCIDASSVYERYAEQQCGGYNFGTYMSEWVEQHSAETGNKNRQLFLLGRSSPGVESNNRPIPRVGTLGDWLGSLTTEEVSEQSTTHPPSIGGSFVYEGDADGVYSFGHYMLDWMENQAAEVEHKRQLLLQRRSSVEPCPSVDWWPQHQDDEQPTTEVEEELRKWNGNKDCLLYTSRCV